MAKKDKKGFNAGVYAVAASIVLAVVLVIMTIFTVATKYTAFSPEKLAQSYVDGIVQTGDGYNAYKVTLLSKNMKYGEAIALRCNEIRRIHQGSIYASLC